MAMGRSNLFDSVPSTFKKKERLQRVLDNLFSPNKLGSEEFQIWMELMKDDKTWDKFLEAKLAERKAELESNNG